MFVSQLGHLHVRAEKAMVVNANDELIVRRVGKQAAFSYEADACGDCNIDAEIQMHSLHTALDHYLVSVAKVQKESKSKATGPRN